MSGRRLRRGGGLAALVAAGAVLAGCAATAPQEAAAPRGPEPGADALRLDPKGLIGMDGTRLRQLLGTPQFVRHEPTAEVWRYRYGTCQVYLFLYIDSAAAAPQAPRLRYMEMRGMAGPVATPADCRAAPGPAPEATQS